MTNDNGTKSKGMTKVRRRREVRNGNISVAAMEFRGKTADNGDRADIREYGAERNYRSFARSQACGGFHGEAAGYA
jgi:hypothetical protein